MAEPSTCTRELRQHLLNVALPRPVPEERPSQVRMWDPEADRRRTTQERPINANSSKGRSRLNATSPKTGVRGIPNQHLVSEINENATPFRLLVQHPTSHLQRS